MSEQSEITMKDLVEWEKLHNQLALLKAKEMDLRKRIYAHYFPAPKEGTNNHSLAEGYLLKAQRKIDRKVNQEDLLALASEGGPFLQAGIDANSLIRWVPELEIKAYRALPDDKRIIFEQCLTIKDGSPQLDIVLPAKARK